MLTQTSTSLHPGFAEAAIFAYHNALWNAACRKAILALHCPTRPDQTGSDPLYAWHVMDLARRLRRPQDKEG